MKKVKNISENSMGDKVGRIHVERQDLNKMAVRRVDALRNNKRKPDPASSKDNDDDDDDKDDAESEQLKKNFKKKVKGGI